jgi:hypothetical protein
MVQKHLGWQYMPNPFAPMYPRTTTNIYPQPPLLPPPPPTREIDWDRHIILHYTQYLHLKKLNYLGLQLNTYICFPLKINLLIQQTRQINFWCWKKLAQKAGPECRIPAAQISNQIAPFSTRPACHIIIKCTYSHQTWKLHGHKNWKLYHTFVVEGGFLLFLLLFLLYAQPTF